ncbi:hypothetical protein Bbelb_108590 [Branchiostoma belcheri]|nr:hypothetical protein Bbelb_108590 [Branchiostoma belcheri]
MEAAGRDQVSQGDGNTASSPPEEPPKEESDALPPETGPAGDTSAQQSLPSDTDTAKPSEPPGTTQELPPSSLSQDAGNKSPRQEPTIQERTEGEFSATITTTPPRTTQELPPSSLSQHADSTSPRQEPTIQERTESTADNTNRDTESKSLRQEHTIQETAEGDADSRSPRQEPTLQETTESECPVTVGAHSEATRPKCLRIADSDRSASLRSQTRCKGTTKNRDSKAEDRNGNVRGAGRKTGTISDKTSTGDSTFFSPLKAYCWICLEPCKIAAGAGASRAGLCLCSSCCPSAYTEPDLSSPCGCTGSLQYVHRACLKRWVREQGSHTCRICNEFYHIPPAQSLCQRLSEEGVVGTCCPSLRHHANTVVFVTLMVLFVGVVSTLGYSTANTYMELKKQSQQNPEGGTGTMIILVFGLSLSLLIVLSVLMCVYVTCVTRVYYRNRRGSYDVPTGDQEDRWEEIPLEEVIQASELEYQELQQFWDNLPPEVREIAAREGFVLPDPTPREEDGTPAGESDHPREEEGIPSGEADDNTDGPREVPTSTTGESDHPREEETTPPGGSGGNNNDPGEAAPPPTGSSVTQRIQTGPVSSEPSFGWALFRGCGSSPPPSSSRLPGFEGAPNQPGGVHAKNVAKVPESPTTDSEHQVVVREYGESTLSVSKSSGYIADLPTWF